MGCAGFFFEGVAWCRQQRFPACATRLKSNRIQPHLNPLQSKAQHRLHRATRRRPSAFQERPGIQPLDGIPMCKHQIQSAREHAFFKQRGRCFYCGVDMWLRVPQEITEPFDLAVTTAEMLRCTAEHLQPKASGGSDRRSNIVAACYRCNTVRTITSSPEEHRDLVQSRMYRGDWHDALVHRVIRNMQ